eukprot:1159650-Pelagomonas_calceolata.AAC.2
MGLRERTQADWRPHLLVNAVLWSRAEDGRGRTPGSQVQAECWPVIPMVACAAKWVCSPNHGCTHPTVHMGFAKKAFSNLTAAPDC